MKFSRVKAISRGFVDLLKLNILSRVDPLLNYVLNLTSYFKRIQCLLLKVKAQGSLVNNLKVYLVELVFNVREQIFLDLPEDVYEMA